MNKFNSKLSFFGIFGCLVFACSCAPLYPNQIKLGDQWKMQAGIKAYYRFDEASLGTAPGGNDFSDSSGLGPPAKSHGPLTLGANGVKNLGISSSGAGSVSIPLDLSAEKVVTLSIWVNPKISAVNSQNVLFEYTSDSSSGNGFLASLDDNSGSPLHAFLVWMHSPNGFFARTTPTLSPGWHNIITTYDRSQSSQNSITLYLDGTLISTNTFAGQNNSAATPFANSTLYLLCRAGTTLCLQADLDELIIWNRSITPAEIQAVHSF